MEILILVPPAIATTMVLLTKAVKNFVEAVRANAESDKFSAEADYLRTQDVDLRDRIAERRRFVQSRQGLELAGGFLVPALMDAGDARAASAVGDELALEARRIHDGEPKPLPASLDQNNARALVEAAAVLATYGIKVELRPK